MDNLYARSVFFVQDAERSLRFYTERLGFSEDWNVQEEGRTTVCQVSLFGFELILNHRRAWNVQRVFWFDWRDPAPASKLVGTCSFCLSAGLLRYTRDPKPSYLAFKKFAGGD